MKFQLLLLASALSASAFPSYLNDLAERDLTKFGEAIDTVLKRIDREDLKADIGKKRATAWSPDQLIDVTGEHEWRAPTKGQIRGTCPGLNVLANHGYFDRSGVTSYNESLNALMSVYNLGPNLGTILVAYSIALIGDPIALTWSIGGPTKATGNYADPIGIDNSHNNYESDASVTRGDSYLHNGDVVSLQMSTFKKLYALQSGPNANYDHATLNKHRGATIDFSRQNNPHYFFGPFSGLVLSTAAYNFIPTFFSNHTEQFPDGILNQENLKSWFGVTGNNINSLKWNPGTERIPNNYYRKPDEYDAPGALADILALIKAYPQAAAVGGNTGRVNSFVPVDMAKLTGGAINSTSLLEGANILCFSYGAARANLPSLITGDRSYMPGVLNFLDNKLANILPTLGCPDIKWNFDLFKVYPGYTHP